MKKTRKIMAMVLLGAVLLAGCGNEEDLQEQTTTKSSEVVTMTVEAPTTTVEEPTTTVEAPTTTVEEPTTTVEAPTTTVEEPTTTVEVPTTTVEEPTTSVEEPTTTPTTSEGVKIAETDIPGIYWREEYIGEEYGWYGEFMVINSDGTVYTWVQAEEGSGDANVFKIAKVTPYDSEAVSYGGNGDYLIYGGDDIIIYSSNSGGTSFAGYDYAVSEGGRSYRQGRMPEGYYVPGNVVFEKGNSSTEAPTEAPHEHAYTEAVTLEATCTADGEKTFTCECGDSYKETITALGHAYVEDETTKVKATCEVDGKASDKKCSVCGDVVVGEVVSATGHIFETYTSNNDATYTADGTETAKCNNCDATDTRVAEGSMLAYSYTDMDATMYVQKGVNVRSLPTKSGEKLGSLSTNDEVKVTGQCAETSWYRIEYNGQVGYVNNSYLGNEKVVVKTQSESLAEHYGITLPLTATVNEVYTHIALLWNSNTSFDQDVNFICAIPDGTRVTIHELSGEKDFAMAYVTTADGISGWVNFSRALNDGSCYFGFSW